MVVLRMLSCFLAFWGLGADSEVRAAFSHRGREAGCVCSCAAAGNFLVHELLLLLGSQALCVARESCLEPCLPEVVGRARDDRVRHEDQQLLKLNAVRSLTRLAT